jgi:hypothetical protein
MKKEFLFIVLLAIIIIVLVVVLVWPFNKNNALQSTTKNDNSQQRVEGITVILPKQNDIVSSPIKITGFVNAGGWAGFEGQVGTVKLLDAKGSQIGKTAILKAVTEWTEMPTEFETTLIFTTNYKGPATLMFSNENPSGDPERDKKFGLTIVIK